MVGLILLQKHLETYDTLIIPKGMKPAPFTGLSNSGLLAQCVLELLQKEPKYRKTDSY